jgi:hypothetical protein
MFGTNGEAHAMQGDSKLFSRFPWPVIFNPETAK